MHCTFLAADLNGENLRMVREGMRRLASKQDITYQMFVVTQPRAWHEIDPSIWEKLCIAWIHADYPDALSLGEKIYASNPFCRLLYYRRGTANMIPLLSSRPVRYADITGGLPAICSILETEYERFLCQQGNFHYADRYQKLAIPYACIHYFTSHDRMTYYCTAEGEQGPLRRSLEQITQTLNPNSFLRCHKSYLVQKAFCAGLDRKTRELLLRDGQKIPVSRAYWAQAEAVFEIK